MSQFIMYCILIAIFLETTVMFSIIVLGNENDD